MTFYEELLTGYNIDLNHSGVSGERIAKRLDEISRIGAEENNGVTRIGYSREEKRAKELVAGWMKEVGLEVSMDGAGNVFGRLEGENKGPAILSGSHLDSVPKGGNFDGPLGVLAALEVVEAWRQTGYTPPFPFEVVIFSDEEGSRFNAGMTGSESFMGKMKSEDLDNLIDQEGNTFDEVIKIYDSSREKFLNPSSKEKDIQLFVEVHIEQGKVLEKHNQPVGIVSGIAGPAWLEVTFEGQAGHAGNTSMENRKDPVIAAGIFVSEIEALPRKVSEMAVATVGKLKVLPNGVNVIAQEVNLMVDIRDIREETRDRLIELIYQKAEEVADKRGIEVTWNLNTKIRPLPIEKNLQEKLANVMDEMNIEPIYIPSGAGHDSMIVGEEIPVAMLFARSRDGISHNPKEWTSLDDCVLSVHVLKKFVEKEMIEKAD
ncbi:M20 family metallo-hydrolase [Oceanobacillus halophilus]|uniref:Zn-dependent hydrolase n=1 Tax=Oceanobacillus halophilus TaxID=930130 RepID=A0A495A8C1_9BACI|nr:M20 family metallo-hydrolase [Oceanobacillus halophilus]RKQ34695.1 Zn-dependent hydrolase [Oceanobacillus halophilus]